jgi:hypothetical protein
MTKDEIYRKILEERRRQDGIYGNDGSSHTIAEWMLILNEEIGEVNKDACDLYFAMKRGYNVNATNFEKELVQSAAVIFRILEHIEQ